MAANRVCEAIRRHAETCQENPEDVSSVVRDGEALRESVLAYEAVLLATSRWSNPIRHLGPLPPFNEQQQSIPAIDDVSSPTADLPKIRIQVRAHYDLYSHDEDALLAFVRGRFAVEVPDVEQAIRMLYEAESWDAQRYPPGLLNLEAAHVDVSVDPAS